MASSQCCENPPTLDPAYGRGHVAEDLGGLKTYITGSDESKLAIILISDVFGIEAPHLRELADKVAESGFYVIVPDFFHGDPFIGDPYKPESSKRPLMDWLKDHEPDKGFEEGKLVIAALKAKGISAIGAAGFCWGAKAVVELAKIEYINAAAILHPAFVTVDDIKEVKCPISILGAEFDQTGPPELLKEFEQVLSSKSEVDSFVKIFPGVAHGWTIRYDINDKAVVEKAEESHMDMLDWFVKYVK